MALAFAHIPEAVASTSAPIELSNRPYGCRPTSKSFDRRFQTKFALVCTSCALGLLFILALCFSEWSVADLAHDDHIEQFTLRLDQDANEGAAANDYSESRCEDIFKETNSAEQRCSYATTCEGEGLLLPFIFCNPPSTSAWIFLLSPFLLLALTLLFRLLGSTADEYFSPSLEMFSSQMGLPPRFAGVTLLALGNGAADVSATINAIASDPDNGYKMSLGALTGAAMFITTCIVGAVVVVNDGVRCRGAAVRDVMALAITVLVVGINLGFGEVDKKTSKTFISIYITFVLIVLVADIYHRAIMLPRLKHEVEMRERQRQMEAERIAGERAGEVLNSMAGGLSSSAELDGQQQPALDEQTHHANTPNRLQGPESPKIGNRALNAVLTALSNYNDEDNEETNAVNGWGVESEVEGTRSWDRPIVLHGSDGILTKHHHHAQQYNDEDGIEQFNSPYRVMEDLDAIDRMCIQEGSGGRPAYNWVGAFHDSKQELVGHFRECWRGIMDDEESGGLEKFLLTCEFPVTVFRKFTIAIPCEGSYCRPLVAVALALSPLWFGFYLRMQFDINLWDIRMVIFLTVTSVLGMLVIRYAPDGDGTMAAYFSVPIALYGFVVAATWIDCIADKLVDVLDFLGIVLRIPNSIMGLTVLAWGNSMADLSANVTMARKGLANMAITACFAGPIFNILVGLGAGFGVLRSVTGEEVKYVSLTPSIKTGFLFCFINCILLLITGLLFNKGTMTAGYGYFAVSLYAVYIITSFVLQYMFNDQ